jgi:predicted aconitase
MVSIKVDIEFTKQESEMLEIAANLGADQPNNDQLKSIILHAAFGHIKRFTMGVIEEHHANSRPPSSINDQLHRLELRRHKLNDDIDKINRSMDELRSMRLPTVRAVPPSPSNKR